MEGARQDVLKVVGQLSAAWRAGDVTALRALLDERAVFVQPGFAGRLEGREACVDSFRRFVASVELIDYSEDEVQADVWADTAVVSYRWRMAFSPPGGKIRREAGRDLLTLRRKAGRWVVVWRTLVPGA
jgi:ketosteroid isomerase-like protein